MRGLCFNDKNTVLVEEMREEPLFLVYQLTREMMNYKGVYFCHKEFKMIFARPVCPSWSFSGTNDYSKRQIHQCFEGLLSSLGNDAN